MSIASTAFVFAWVITFISSSKVFVCDGLSSLSSNWRNLSTNPPLPDLLLKSNAFSKDSGSKILSIPNCLARNAFSCCSASRCSSASISALEASTFIWVIRISNSIAASFFLVSFSSSTVSRLNLSCSFSIAKPSAPVKVVEPLFANASIFASSETSFDFSWLSLIWFSRIFWVACNFDLFLSKSSVANLTVSSNSNLSLALIWLIAACTADIFSVSNPYFSSRPTKDSNWDISLTWASVNPVADILRCSSKSSNSFSNLFLLFVKLNCISTALTENFWASLINFINESICANSFFCLIRSSCCLKKLSSISCNIANCSFRLPFAASKRSSWSFVKSDNTALSFTVASNNSFCSAKLRLLFAKAEFICLNDARGLSTWVFTIKESEYSLAASLAPSKAEWTFLYASASFVAKSIIACLFSAVSSSS